MVWGSKVCRILCSYIVMFSPDNLAPSFLVWKLFLSFSCLNFSTLVPRNCESGLLVLIALLGELLYTFLLSPFVLMLAVNLSYTYSSRVVI